MNGDVLHVYQIQYVSDCATHITVLQTSSVPQVLCSEVISGSILAFSGYMKTIHRPENHVILLHVPEVLDTDRNSKS